METSHRAAGRPKRKRGDRLELRLEGAEKQAFQEAANLAGIPLSSWVRERLRQAAQRELEGNAVLPGPQSADRAVPPEVAAFRDQEELTEALATAIELAGKHFQLFGTPVITLEQDPELENNYLVIGITTRGETSKIVAAHSNYAREWTSRIPWPKSEKVRIEYDVI